MPNPDFKIEMATSGDESMVAIKPPVDIAFRERMFDILSGLGLMKEIVVNGAPFFETKALRDGSSSYSELRIPSNELELKGVRLVNLAHECKDVLREQGKTAYVDPHLKSLQGKRQLFDN